MNEAFLESLRDGLNHLHDPDHLCRSPLAALFGVADRLDTYAALQRILTEAIESLEPKADVPANSRAWRIYDLLSCRYVQELSVPVVANQLGMSVRHLHREQQAALKALAHRLWQQFDLDSKIEGDAEEAPSQQPCANGRDVGKDLAWLKSAPPERPTDVGQALHDVLGLVRPLADKHGAALDVSTDESLPALAVHPVALSEILLSLLSVAARQTQGGHISVSARSLRWEVEVQMRCQPFFSDRPPVSDEDEAGLDLARQLTDLCGGSLAVSLDGQKGFSATLALPAVEQVTVLAIDDNTDTLQLLQRFVSGSRYRVVGTSDPEQAVRLAEELSPQIIVLDVMMPQLDGWKLLGWLHQHPVTGHTPIVVCTILAQEELAFTLGASGFVRKPITQEAFLTVLEEQMAQLESL